MSTFSLIAIGTELLTGKRQDAHLARVIELLSERGLDLASCLFVVDDPERITRTLAESMRGRDVTFCYGGIGATPDDHTRACAAQAANLPLVRHPGAAALIEERFGEQAYPQRIRMADLPQGASLIPNPVNQIAGFSLADHHFMPGFPQMAWPMTQWLIDTRYARLHRSAPRHEALLNLPGITEGQLIAIMEAFVERFPGVQLSCLPHMEGDYRETELGVRGESDAVDTAARWLSDELDREGFTWERK